MNALDKSYFKWMADKIIDQEHDSESVIQFLQWLNREPYEYWLDMDGNRFEDGINLRYRFGYENNYDQRIISRELDHRPCSMLEMMVALSIRIEEEFMDNPSLGDRTPSWFWLMVSNLGLSIVDPIGYWNHDVLQTFFHNAYSYNGVGGLFIVKHPKYDMRKVEIWMQAMWYLDEMMENGG